jgi:aminomethyltransferase
MEVGEPLGLKPGHTSSIRRIEAAMLSYQADMTLANNPYELGLDRLVNLDMEAEFVSKSALTRIRNEGVSQLLVGLEFDGSPLVGSNDEHWPITRNEKLVGRVTSAIYSPRLKKNIALAMIAREHAEIGTCAVIDTLDRSRNCEVVPIPFYDPKKSIATQTVVSSQNLSNTVSELVLANAKHSMLAEELVDERQSAL